MLEFNAEQPSVRGLVDRISQELNAKATMLIHENGQVLHRSGWLEEEDYPPMAALVAAMLAAGKSLGKLAESLLGPPSRFACDSESLGLYTVAVTPDIWLAVIYEQPLNPGQFRMKIRRYAQLLAQLGVQQPVQWEHEQETKRKVARYLQAGANLPPVSKQEATSKELITPVDTSLFGDITDEEINQLFENARS